MKLVLIVVAMLLSGCHQDGKLEEFKENFEAEERTRILVSYEKTDEDDRIGQYNGCSAYSGGCRVDLNELLEIARNKKYKNVLIHAVEVQKRMVGVWKTQ